MQKINKVCNFCGNRNFRLVYNLVDYKTKRPFSIIRCQRCKLAVTTPFLSKTNLIKHYYGYRQNSGKRFGGLIESFIYFWHMSRVNHIKRLVNKGKILDVGCGRGSELEILKKDGWSTYATEFSKDLKESLLEKGIKLFLGEIWGLNTKKGSFDVITLWHSLEHITNPNRVIRTSRKLLRSKGYLVIAVPNFDCWERKLFGTFWFHLDVPRHLYHFPKRTLTQKLEDHEFKIVCERYAAPEYDFYSLWQGSLNKIFPKYPNLIYNILHKNSNNKTREKVIAIIQLPVLLIVIILSVFIVPFFWLNKKSGTVEITAQKL